jgi:hypothetical protein
MRLEIVTDVTRDLLCRPARAERNLGLQANLFKDGSTSVETTSVGSVALLDPAFRQVRGPYGRRMKFAPVFLDYNFVLFGK